jgi:hypothetical protein
MKGFFRFISSSAGRIVRVVAGLVLIVLGLLAAQGAGRWVLIVVGLVPLLAGIFDWCVFAPLFSLPFIGEQLRRAVQE